MPLDGSRARAGPTEAFLSSSFLQILATRFLNMAGTMRREVFQFLMSRCTRSMMASCLHQRICGARLEEKANSIQKHEHLYRKLHRRFSMSFLALRRLESAIQNLFFWSRAPLFPL